MKYIDRKPSQLITKQTLSHLYAITLRGSAYTLYVQIALH
jgi:hypothetical protein